VTRIVSDAARIMSVCAALLFSTTPPTAAQSGDGQVLNYEGADLRAVINDVASYTGRTFVLDPSVNGKVTVYSSEPMSADAIWEVFTAALSAAGFAATPSPEGYYKIVPVNSAAREAGADDDVSGETFVTRVFALEHADAREAAANVKPLLGPASALSAIVSENILIVADTASRVARVGEIIKGIDQDTTSSVTVTMQNSSAQEAARIVQEVLGGQAETGRRRLRATAAPAINAVILRGSDDELAAARALLRDLDQEAVARGGVEVVFLVHADAEELAEVLDRFASDQASATAAASGEGRGAAGPSSVAAYAPANALIITADTELRRVLKSVAQSLDVRRPQVRVEAIIVEINDTLTRDLGLQYFLSGDGGNAVPFTATNFSRASPNLLAGVGAALLGGFDSEPNTTVNDGDSNTTTTTQSPAQELAGSLAEAALSSLIGVNGGIFGGGGQFSDGTIFGAILTAIQEDTESNILSTPSILTLDNQESSFLVGQDVPLTTGESLGANNVNPFRTVQREEIGIVLEVTPQINDGDTVTLKIRQEVSSIFGTVSLSSDELIIDKREIETTAVAGDGEIIVLGGLIDEQEVLSESKVPFLGDIPFLGRLFQTSSRQRSKRNLVVLIRPTIIRDDDDARAVTRDVYNYINADALLRRGGDGTQLDRYLDKVLGEGTSEAVTEGVEPGAR